MQRQVRVIRSPPAVIRLEVAAGRAPRPQTPPGSRRVVPMWDDAWGGADGADGTRGP